MATTDFVVKNGLVVTENAVINETTDATSKDSGALVVEGGVGIEKKLYVGTDLNVGSATALTGDLAVNGGDITTSSTTATLFNTTATTVNIAGAATDVQIGAATGTTEINNNLNVVGDVDIDGGDLTASTTSFNLVNTTVTTLNVGGAATTVNAGAAGSAGTFTIKNDNTVLDGDLQVKGGDLTTNQATFNLLNTTATTVNIAGAATDVQIGAATGTTEINNNLNVVGDVDIDGGDLTVSTVTFNLANTTATTVNFAGAATTLEIGAATGTTNINNSLDVDGDINIDGGDLTVSTGTFNLANTTATIVNFAGAGTTISIGAATGTTTINNANTVVTGDLAVNGADITTSSTGTATVFNANATTLNMGQAATTVSIGATTGTTTVRNSLAINGNATLGDASGDTITINSSTATVPNTLTLTVDDAVTNNIAYPVKISHTTSGTPANGIGTGIQFITETAAANNEIGMLIEAAVTDVTATSEDFDFVVKLMAAGAAAAERFRVNSVGNVTVVGDLAVNGGDITSSATIFNLLNSTVTTLNVGGAATTVEIGAATGTTSVNNALTVDGVFTANGNTVLGDSTADTVTVTGTMQPGVVISGSSEGNALRITQTGTGNALLIEDSVNPDATPFVVSNDGTVIRGYTDNVFSSGIQSVSTSPGNSAISVGSFSASGLGAPLRLYHSRSGVIPTNTVVQSADELGKIEFYGADGASYIQGASITAAVDGAPGTNNMPGRLSFSTTPNGASSPIERMRIDSAGSVGIGGAPGVSSTLDISRNLSGSATPIGVYSRGVIQSDATGDTTSFYSRVGTQATTFTSANLRHFRAFQGTFGAGSTVTNQFGFVADSSIVGATNNYGFHSNIPASTGDWNFYANGTAANYFSGDTLFGKITNDNTTVGVAVTSSAGLVSIVRDGNVPLLLNRLSSDGSIIDLRRAGTTVGLISGATGSLSIIPTGFLSLGAAPGAESLRVVPVASAVNYLNVLGAVTGNAVTISAQGSDTNVNFSVNSKGTGATTVYTPTSVGSAVTNKQTLLNVQGQAGSNVVMLRSWFERHTAGADWEGVGYKLGQVVDVTEMSNIEFNPIGQQQGLAVNVAFGAAFQVKTQGGEQFRVTNTASAVNFLQVTGGAAGTGPTFSAVGSDTNVNLRLAPKGTGTVQELYNGTYYDIVSQFDIGTNPNQIPLNQYLGTMAYQNAEAVTIGTLAVTGATSLGTGSANYLSVGGASSGNPVSITTLGSDANIGLTITTKGTGNIILDTGASTGDIELKPGAANLRLWDDDSSHYYTFVTGNRSANYNINLPVGDVTLVAGTMITSAGGTFTGQVISTLANNTADGGGQIFLNGATGNRIDFNTNGVAAPAFTTRSAGTKIVLYPNVGAAAVDYALGMESGAMWSSVATTSQTFKWYGGTTLAATLTGAGALTLTNNLTVSGGTITTGNVGATLLGGNTTTNITVGSGLTSGTFTLGGTATTGTITLDQSNSAHTLNIATGTNAAAVTKTINIGTGGAASSTTNITLGASAGGGSTTLYGNVGIGLVTAYKLDVAGKGRFLQEDAATTGAIILRSNSSNTVGGHIQWVNNTNVSQLGFIAVSPTSDMSIATASTVRITVLANGNVIVGGSTDGGYKLQVIGSFAATTKSFVIDHPTKPDMKLRYGSLEGPENGVYVRGRLNGKNIIQLPDYWTGLVDEDSITVNLTAIGKAQELYVEDIRDNCVYVGGETINCFYTVFAERKDVEKLVVEF